MTRRSGKGSELSPAATLVRRHDRDRYQTALFAPPAAREALFALYAFNYEIARVRESVRENMLGQIRLQWWREAVDTAYGGGPVRQHEIVAALSATIREQALTRAGFDRLIDARERDLDDAPPATLGELETYAEGSSAVLIELALEVLGAATPAAREAGRHVGIAYALTGLMRALPVHARTGRFLIPADVAAEAGLDPGGYAALHSGPPLSRAVARVAGAAQRHLAAARGLRREVPQKALPALLPARIAGNALRRLERAGFDPFSDAVAADDPLQIWRLTYAALVRRF